MRQDQAVRIRGASNVEAVEALRAAGSADCELWDVKD